MKKNGLIQIDSFVVFKRSKADGAAVEPTTVASTEASSEPPAVRVGIALEKLDGNLKRFNADPTSYMTDFSEFMSKMSEHVKIRQKNYHKLIETMSKNAYTTIKFLRTKRMDAVNKINEMDFEGNMTLAEKSKESILWIGDFIYKAIEAIEANTTQAREFMDDRQSGIVRTDLTYHITKILFENRYSQRKEIDEMLENIARYYDAIIASYKPAIAAMKKIDEDQKGGFKNASVGQRLSWDVDWHEKENSLPGSID